MSTDNARQSPIQPAVIAVAVVGMLALVVAMMVLGRGVGDRARMTAASAPVPVVPIPAPTASSRECTELTNALPGTLGEATKVPVVDPAPIGASAYRLPGAEPVIVRCGVGAPAEFTVGAPLQLVDSVQWFRQTDSGPGASSTWVAVDRPQYIALTLPDGSGTGPIQDASAIIAKTLPSVAVRPAPVS